MAYQEIHTRKELKDFREDLRKNLKGKDLQNSIVLKIL